MSTIATASAAKIFDPDGSICAATNANMPGPAAVGGIKPIVLLLYFRIGSTFTETNGRFLVKLHDRANVIIAQNDLELTAILQLYQDFPGQIRAILCTDDAIAQKSNWKTYLLLDKYMREGGTCVLMGDFPRTCPADVMNYFFDRQYLPWICGSLQESTLELSPKAELLHWSDADMDLDVINTRLARLPREYIQTALHLRYVPTGEAWYTAQYQPGAKPNRRPCECDLWMGASSASAGSYCGSDSGNCSCGAELWRFETSTAVTQIGSGRLGYVGDIGGGARTHEIIFAMCRV